MSFEPHPVSGREDDPGSKPDADAAELELSTPVTLGGYVGAIDKLDVYAFDVAAAGKLTLVLQDFKARPNVFVYKVVADDAAFAAEEEVASNIISASAEVTVTLAAGRHFIKIDGETTYTLAASFQPGS